MKTAVLRNKLYTYIEKADKHTLQALYTLIDPDKTRQNALWEDDKFIRRLEERVTEYKKNRKDLKTWAEIKKEIQ